MVVKQNKIADEDVFDKKDITDKIFHLLKNINCVGPKLVPYPNSYGWKMQIFVDVV